MKYACGRIWDRCGTLCVLAAFLLLETAPMAAVVTPLHIGASQSIRDDHGVKLLGRSSVPGDLVQILLVTNGVIEAPDFDGTPHPDTLLVEGGETAIGALTSPNMADEGIFSVSLADPRPGDGSKVFVRAFNAPTLAEASFYGDSALFTVDGNAVFDAVIKGTTNALDGRDFDDDGLGNSWEDHYGTDEYDPDTDGDSMIDGDEIRAGTEATNEWSLLVIANPFFQTNGDIALSWESVPGKKYEVLFTSLNLADNPLFTNAVSQIVVATEDVTSLIITNGVDLGPGMFRVGLVD